jgi:peptide/nickel transport system ATP-binding protein
MSSDRVVQVRDVVVRPGGPGGPVVLNGLTFSLQRGEKVVLAGPSGSGKTTTLRTMAGLLIPDRGFVSRCERIGYMPQHPLTSFDPRWTIVRSVAEPALLAGASKEEAFEQAMTILQSVKLSDVQWQRRPSSLSGGELRRAAVARALATQPDLILADEPTAGLDPEAALQLVDLFGTVSKSIEPGVLWVTHDLGVAAAVSDKIMILEEGRITESTSMQQLVSGSLSETGREMLEAWLPMDRSAARNRLTG